MFVLRFFVEKCAKKSQIAHFSQGEEKCKSQKAESNHARDSARVKCLRVCYARTSLVRACDIAHACKHARVSARACLH